MFDCWKLDAIVRWGVLSWDLIDWRGPSQRLTASSCLQTEASRQQQKLKQISIKSHEPNNSRAVRQSECTCDLSFITTVNFNSQFVVFLVFFLDWADRFHWMLAVFCSLFFFKLDIRFNDIELAICLCFFVFSFHSIFIPRLFTCFFLCGFLFTRNYLL